HWFCANEWLQSALLATNKNAHLSCLTILYRSERDPEREKNVREYFSANPSVSPILRLATQRSSLPLSNLPNFPRKQKESSICCSSQR
ncbi:hypothetical protein, partial [Porphyromonas endodontalis]|uniref:hypothetical protein n=1 Tax=Porphyromonas endodontalis TaxID=28124 RepID=UPI003C7AC160